MCTFFIILSQPDQLGNNFNASGEEDWTPIGDFGDPFTGSLDGNGYLIRNLTVNISVSSSVPTYGGFFGRAGAPADLAVISNVALRDVSITVNQNSAVAAACPACVGGLLGDCSDMVRIRNNYVTGTVTVTSPATGGSIAAGGLVGLSASSGTFSRNYARVRVIIRNQLGYARAGGLVGNSTAAGTFGKNYATGRATCDSTGSCSGARLGGLLGLRRPGTVANSYWDTDSTETDAGCGGGGMNCNASTNAGLRTAQMQSVTTDPTTSPIGLGDGFQFSAGYYPKLYLCEINPMTNGCRSGSFSTELLPGQ